MPIPLCAAILTRLDSSRVIDPSTLIWTAFRLRLGIFLDAEYDDLPEQVRTEVQTVADITIAWLAGRLVDAGLPDEKASEARARAIFAAVAGPQLLARSCSEILTLRCDDQKL